MGSFCGKPVADEEHAPKAALKATAVAEVSVAAVVPSSVPVPVVGPSDATSPADLAVEQIAISVVQSTELTLSLEATVQESLSVSPLQETVDPVQQTALSSHAAHSSSSDSPSVPIPSSVVDLVADHPDTSNSSTSLQQDGQIAPAGAIQAPTAVSSPQPTLVPASETVMQVEVPSIAVDATSQLPQQVSGSADPAATPASSVTLTDYMWSPAASEGGSGIVPPLTAAVEVVPTTIEAAPVTVQATSVEAATVEEALPAPVEIEQPAAVSVAQPAVVEVVAAAVAEVKCSAAAVTELVATFAITEEKPAQANLQPLHSASAEIQPQLSAAAPIFTPAASIPSPSVSTSAAVQPVVAAAVASVAVAPVIASPVVATQVVIAPVASAGVAATSVRSAPVATSSAAKTPVQASKGSSIPSAPAGPAVKTASHGPFHSQNGQMTTRTKVMVDFLPKKDAQEVMSKLGAIPQESAEEKAKPSKAAAAAAVPGASVAKGKAKPKAKGKGKK